MATYMLGNNFLVGNQCPNTFAILGVNISECLYSSEGREMDVSFSQGIVEIKKHVFLSWLRGAGHVWLLILH